jgi:uncharacterized metal-binding protein YceD (DUF177 family)
VNVTMTTPIWQWRVPVRIEDVPEAGLHLEVSADTDARAGLATLAGVREISRLDATIDVTRQGKGLRAIGRLSGTVGQSCVVTLEPVENSVDESFDVTFVPPAAGDAGAGDELNLDDPPEVLVDGIADLGAIMTEFLLLGIDPYPRIPGAVFAPPVEANDESGPFSVLAKLRNPS